MVDAASAGLLFDEIMNNRFVRRVLAMGIKKCDKDGKLMLEVALELYTGVRKTACAKCTLYSKVISYVINFARNWFGVNEEQLKELLKVPYYRRALISVIAGIAWFGVRRPFVPGAPFQIVWNVTKACNLRCKHCYENAGSKARDELNTIDALKVIKRLADAGVVILAFSGGEPSIRPDIETLIRYASMQGMYVAMATNGTTLTKERVKRLKEAGLQFVQISLDGATAKTHDSFRGIPGAFDRTIMGIRNAVDAGLFVEIATTVTKFNYHEIPDIIELANKLGVNWFMAYNFVPIGRGREIINFDLSPAEREELLRMLIKLGGKYKVELLSTAPQYARVALQMNAKVNDATIVPTHFYNPKLSGKLKRLADFIGGCGAGRFYLSLEPNGDIYPCVFFPHEPEVKVGNILKDDFIELWKKSPLLWTLRDKDKLASPCGTCKFRYVCGGCRARAYNYFRDLRAPDPGCIYATKYWELLKKEEVKLVHVIQ
ncbi:MAG: radical SAM protein [Candidatus Asgardarchaeia archaeon]